MRSFIVAGGLALITATPALALQTAPGGVTGGGDQPLLLKSIEPDLSTDPASIDDLRHKMQEDKKGKRSARGKSDQARPAQVAEIVAGKPVHDTAGQVIAQIQKVEADGAILQSGMSVVRVPLEGFGINKKGLLLNLTKPQFDELVATSGVAAPAS